MSYTPIDKTPLGDCPRTLAVYRPGERLPGTNHRFAYSGTIPCTGPRKCLLCGQEVQP